MQILISLLIAEEIVRPTYHATPIISIPTGDQLNAIEHVAKKPRLEYRPIPTFKPTATYTATVIKKTEKNSYVPQDGETKSSPVTYVPSKINSTIEHR